MLTAIQDEKVVIARDTEKRGIFTCPECGRTVTLKKGKIVIHHFAHKPPVTCQYGKGESKQHHQIKMELFDSLVNHDQALDVALEKSFGAVRPDVSARIDGKLVAFEIQRTSINFDDLHRRTSAYCQLGLSVIWILLPREDLSSNKISPRKWEIWTHAAQLGEAYYWIGKGYVQPVKFDKYMIEVPLTDFGGGYERTSKRFRTPIKQRKAHLVEDFTHGGIIKAWSGGVYDIPARRIWMRMDKYI
ncbi:competence protein CoiA [Erwinia tracheiphila]|uniref:competence protein CoiA n=1 Tax=Erwinia tracheiphila TaxID=65700 RepID=UPI00033D5B65|nr:competence protein CoiA family protein [Erwinia tracheiphila]EOS94792.1 competence protein CoiA-like family protein [Erwinia tracheiphila PSU-1]UIA88411.1 competence protein CoiA [Erwinia tracheiphila]UIA96785.1 competence protein CoiA [Erwinia tracheiphila]